MIAIFWVTFVCRINRISEISSVTEQKYSLIEAAKKNMIAGE